MDVRMMTPPPLSSSWRVFFHTKTIMADEEKVATSPEFFSLLPAAGEQSGTEKNSPTLLAFTCSFMLAC